MLVAREFSYSSVVVLQLFCIALCRALKAQEATKKAKQLAQVGGPDSQVSNAPTTTQTREDDTKVRKELLDCAISLSLHCFVSGPCCCGWWSRSDPFCAGASCTPGKGQSQQWQCVMSSRV